MEILKFITDAIAANADMLSGVDMRFYVCNITAFVALVPIGIASVVQCARRCSSGIPSATLLLLLSFVFLVISAQLVFAQNMYRAALKINADYAISVDMEFAWFHFTTILWFVFAHMLVLILSATAYAVGRNPFRRGEKSAKRSMVMNKLKKSHMPLLLALLVMAFFSVYIFTHFRCRALPKLSGNYYVDSYRMKHYIRLFGINGVRVSCDTYGDSALMIDISDSNAHDLLWTKGLYIKQIKFNNTRINDISPLADQRDITHLEMNNTHVSDISVITNIAKLERLEIENSQVTNLAAISMLPIHNLNIRGTAVSDLSCVPTNQLRRIAISWSDETPWRCLEKIRALNNLVIVTNQVVVADIGSFWKKLDETTQMRLEINDGN